LHEWASEFTDTYSEGDPKYVSRSAQADGVVNEVQTFLRELPNATKWQTWDNLSPEQLEEATGGGGLADYDDVMQQQRDELTTPLLRIMWGVDKQLFDFLMDNTENIDWGGITTDYTQAI
jgi:hypothetical protein